jgi:hypothetical protein
MSTHHFTLDELIAVGQRAKNGKNGPTELLVKAFHAIRERPWNAQERRTLDQVEAEIVQELEIRGEAHLVGFCNGRCGNEIPTWHRLCPQCRA